MKKFIVLLILALTMCGSMLIKPKTFTFNTYFNNGVIYTYTSHPINDTSILLVGTYMSLNSNGADENDIIGECIYFDNLEVSSAITKLKAKVKFTEYIEEQHLTIIYAYSNLIPISKQVNNHKVNLQISTCNEYSAIGWPLIYGGF